MTILIAIATIIGIVGVTAGLIFNAYQIRILASQGKTQNEIAKAASIYNGVTGLSSFYRVFVDYPGLRKYFYDGAPVPSDQEELDRVIPLAEMLADTIDSVLRTIYRFGEQEDHSDWTTYTEYMLDRSPTLKSLVLEHPVWWPDIARLLQEDRPVETSAEEYRGVRPVPPQALPVPGVDSEEPGQL